MAIEISLEGQRALITGASQGIGEGIAAIPPGRGGARRIWPMPPLFWQVTLPAT